jgi:glycosyltransferase involved in cell wall biosynthesis
MKILYHSPRPAFDMNRGSGKRPYEMYNAFKNLGHNVDIIQGSGSSRLKKIFDRQYNWRNYDFCYSEPPTSPLHPVYDYPFILKIQKNNVPFSVFYRDTYWKFPEYSSKKGIKKPIYTAAHYTDCKIFSELADIVYFPSDFASEISFSASTTDTLPPGCNPTKSVQDGNVNTIIYVGGILGGYGIQNLIQTMDLLSEEDIMLNLVCRENEYSQISEKKKKKINDLSIDVLHRSGDDLIPLYKKSDIGIMPRKDTYYNNMTMPVKMFEYISFGLPIVATNCKKISDFIQATNCGRVCEQNPKKYAENIKYLCENEETTTKLSNNAHIAAKSNTWRDRAQKVCDYFS